MVGVMEGHIVIYKEDSYKSKCCSLSTVHSNFLLLPLRLNNSEYELGFLTVQLHQPIVLVVHLLSWAHILEFSICGAKSLQYI